MKIFTSIMVLLCLAVLARTASATMYVEKFNSDKDGIKYGYGTDFHEVIDIPQWISTGGNPGGYVSGTSENLYAVWTFNTAPYGDMTGLTMTIDTKVTDAETGTAQFYVGRGGAYFIDGSWNISADKTWTTHQIGLVSSNFHRWTGSDTGAYTFEQVLQAPDDIGIFFGGSVAQGSGALDVDNFGTVPEPATLCLLGLGGLMLRKRRQ